ncbi:ribosome assembly protein 3 [Stagonosporopsis vannaccii]|nr:ribosome assembly protein 3 [Stagonosporopsis vannaccii]
MSSSPLVLSAISIDKSTTSNPGTPTACIFSPKFSSEPKAQKKPVFESPPPSYTRDLTQAQKTRLPDEDLRISAEEGVDLFLSRSLIHVQVEHNNVVRDFYIHRDLLLARSPFFRDQVSNPDTFSVQSPWCQTIRLSDVRPATFGIYINLLYMKRLTTRGPKEWHWLCRLYILAEKLQDVETKNTVIDVSSSESSSESEVEQKKIRKSPSTEPESVETTPEPTPKPAKKEKKRAKSTPATTDGDTPMIDASPSPSPAPVQKAASTAKPQQAPGKLAEDFDAIYIRKITTELADDLDIVRSAQDFKANSIPMLIHALKQGESLFSAEEKRRVVATAKV